jgi:probable phosphoglycerate mutase
MGWAPVVINATGRAQIEQLAERLKNAPIRAIYASPLARTMESAAILAAPLGLTPIPDERWTETKITGWEGKLWSELAGHPIRERYYAAPTEVRRDVFRSGAANSRGRGVTGRAPFEQSGG